MMQNFNPLKQEVMQSHISPPTIRPSENSIFMSQQNPFQPPANKKPKYIKSKDKKIKLNPIQTTKKNDPALASLNVPTTGDNSGSKIVDALEEQKKEAIKPKKISLKDSSIAMRQTEQGSISNLKNT